MSGSAMPVSLLSWKPLRKNTLLGFASVRLGRSFAIEDVSVHHSNGKFWASLPSKPLIDSSGVAKKNDQGKVQYAPVVKWLDRESADRFSQGVIAAIEAEHPGDTAP